MTVKDLIHNLLKYDENLEVYLFHDVFEYTKAEGTNDEDDAVGNRIVVIS
jgi:hypothetical protein